MKSFVAGLAAAVGLVGSMAFAGDPMNSVESVTPGVWSSSFHAAKDYAEKNNIPMLIFFANPGCHVCEKLESACKDDDFVAWQEKMKMVMVFTYGTSGSDKSDSKAFVKNSTGKFPYMGVYWASKMGKDNPVLFSGVDGMKGPDASGKVVSYSTVKGTDRGEQLMSAVEAIIPEWTGGEPGPVKPDPPKPVPPVDPTVDLNSIYGKSVKMSALVMSDDDYFGSATVTFGKISKTKKTVKITIKTKLFTGKTISASKTFTPAKDGSISGTFTFKDPLGDMTFKADYDKDIKGIVFEGTGPEYSISAVEVKIGGIVSKDEYDCTVELDEALVFPEGYAQIGGVPVNEEVYVKNGKKFSFDKSPTLKYVKNGAGYVLTGADDPAKPNFNKLKLSYTSSSGTIKGSFYVYASNAASVKTGKKPTIKKYSAKVNGLMINSEGYGYVTLKIGKQTFYGTCELH